LEFITQKSIQLYITLTILNSSLYNLEKVDSILKYLIDNIHTLIYLYTLDRKASLWRAFQSCFAASANEFYIFWQCTYIVFILQCQKPQNNCQIVYKGTETSVILIIFWWCPLCSPYLYCYRFLPSLNVNQVPEKLYLGQWWYITKQYPVNAT